MTSLMMTLMTEYATRAAEAIQNDRYDEAGFWTQLESYANNCHGMSDSDIITYMERLVTVENFPNTHDAVKIAQGFLNNFKYKVACSLVW